MIFETEKIPDVNEGELPLQVVVDERIDNQELQENETDTEDSAEIQRSEENMRWKAGRTNRTQRSSTPAHSTPVIQRYFGASWANSYARPL